MHDPVGVPTTAGNADGVEEVRRHGYARHRRLLSERPSARHRWERDRDLPFVPPGVDCPPPPRTTRRHWGPAERCLPRGAWPREDAGAEEWPDADFFAAFFASCRERRASLHAEMLDLLAAARADADVLGVGDVGVELLERELGHADARPPPVAALGLVASLTVAPAGPPRRPA